MAGSSNLRRPMVILAVPLLGLILAGQAPSHSSEYSDGAPHHTHHLSTGISVFYPQKFDCPVISSDFKSKTGYKGKFRKWPHTGIDIPVPRGTLILAAMNGKVVDVGNGPRGGKRVIIRHGSSLTTGYLGYSTYYHLSSISVTKGQYVTAGQQIGGAGKTGSSSAGFYHLHFELRSTPGFSENSRGELDYEGYPDSPHDYWKTDPTSTPGTKIIPVFVEDQINSGKYFPAKNYSQGGFMYPISCSPI